ncbi:hypothetical protein DSL72_003556 [Monilinia vaccinii-corymbosi]|uniref:ABC multidrug transporter atrF n=1 Tax=Monilinia vaccinii-corymbosi TaxID=61207 RepID=A0A8A3P1J7_9HELO|nr:hypothetical protein DSL72_003556 [Monilinia vaccinii-corymbosi]
MSFSYTHAQRVYAQRAVKRREGAQIPLHSDSYHRELAQPEDHSSPEGGRNNDGRWGENDEGEPVNRSAAMQDFNHLRHQLSMSSRTRSQNSVARSQNSGPRSQKSITALRRPSGLNHFLSDASRRTQTTAGEDIEENGEEPKPEETAAEVDDEFVLGDFLRDGHFEKRNSKGSAKKVGVVYKNLNVQGVGATSTYVKTLPSAIMGTFGPDLYRLLSRFIPALQKIGSHGQRRDLIHDFTGCVRDGEMLLVLGRPGSGCSTFLKVVSNKRGDYASVTGEVSYGGISAEEQAKYYRGEVNYNEEDDQHFPSLTVEQTLHFSLLNKTRKHEKEDIPTIITALLKMFGMSHTRNTLVGDAFIRGVSGGERKRVSIAETLATKSTVVSWDNSTRGLDASTALDYANSLRVMTDISNRTTLITLYQAGEQIYELMNKVLVIDEGRMVYSGPAGDAKNYFERLGYYCPPRQTTADFLTACTDPVQRQFQKNFHGPIPKGPIELERAFRESEDYRLLLEDVKSYERMLHETDHADARQFKGSVKEAKSKTVGSRSPYTVSFFRQVLACTKREIQLTLGDRATMYTKLFIIISNSLIIGSLFYGQRIDTLDNFSRGSCLFFSIIFLGWLQLAELSKAVSGRSVIARHKDYAFYRPSAVIVARVVQDVPVLLVMATLFCVIVYFMSGLDVDAGKFFIYFMFTYINTLCITCLYRMFAAVSPSIDDAVRFSGTVLNIFIILAGYVIPKPQILSEYIWFGWIYYINPLSYSFEAVMSDEFYNKNIPCAPDRIVPSGPGYTNPEFQGCVSTGSVIGSLNVSGSRYIEQGFSYSRSRLWRNFGVVIAWTALYILVTAIATELFDFSSGGGGALEFKRSRAAKNKVKAENATPDEETSPSSANPATTSRTSPNNTLETPQQESLQDISGSASIFTWENLEYTVPYLGGERKLLNKVNGYAKPGFLVALMGASGAGKSTLLTTLSQRQTTGVVAGDMLVDGRVLGTEFQRGTGFCEQMDLHDGTATVREALEFSAILRQEHAIPRTEKIEYVDKIIDLLELRDMQDVLIRSLGLEQKKRVTIGVELAAKPNLLLFLDEPTSGLDSQSAYSIVRFLKKLSAAGQAIVCTIHQPSSLLIQEFDMILALNPGGNTFYFGPVGENGSAVVKYFADRGVHCPPQKNVAEFVLETAAKGGKRPDGKIINWNKEWLDSEENKLVMREIQRIKAERGKFAAPGANLQREFASPVELQTRELTKRLFIQYWRDPSYVYGTLFISVIIGIFNGFTFWQLGNSVTDMQNRMFTLYVAQLIAPTVVNSTVPKFYQNRALWETRELPSRIYGWVAFCTANIIAEIPFAIAGAVIYWVIWYWAAGFSSDSSTSGYVFLMMMLFFLFQASWAQWICAFAPSFTVIANVLPFFFVMFDLFCGVVRPYSQLNVFWRYWLYYLIPSTYWIGGIISATFSNVPVQCAPEEAAYFNPPSGQSCSSYAGGFVTSSGSGYLMNPDATTNCGYCPYASGEEYMNTLNVSPGDKWRYFGIFLGFCISNWALVYFFIYTVRIRGWSFGFASLFGGLGKVADKMENALKGKKSVSDSE